LNQPVVGMAATPGAGGYWLVAADGGVFNFGDARFLGSRGSVDPLDTYLAILPVNGGSGYWLVGERPGSVVPATTQAGPPIPIPGP
jgi:hypothetical protein